MAWLISSLGGSLALALLLAARPTAAPAQAQAETIEVAVQVKGIARLYSAEIGLRFDPAQVTPIDALPARAGMQLQAGTGWGSSPFVLINEVDPQAGRARFAATLLPPASPLVGDPILVVLRLQLRRLEPEDAWGLTDVLLLDQRGQELASRWEGVEIWPLIDWPSILPRSLLPWAGS